MRFLTLYLFTVFFSYAQREDSLITFIHSISNDTQKVNILYQEGFKIRNTEPNRAFLLAQEAESIAVNTNSPKHLGLVYNLQGILSYKKGQYAEAYKKQSESFELNKLIVNKLGMAHNQINLGNIFSDIRKYELAESSYLNALQYYNEINHLKGKLNCLINLGVVKYEQKQYLPAIKNYQQALAAADNQNDYETKAICCNNLGAILMTINELDSAIGYIEEAIKLKLLTENEMELADSYNNLAVIYINKYEYKKAENYIDTAESIINKYEYFDANLELYHTKYLLNQSQKQFEQANIWLNKYIQTKDSISSIINVDLTEFEFNLNNNKQFSPIEKSNGLIWQILFLTSLSILLSVYLFYNKR
jgi:tetratricopeptide (TPR) repeat protein